VVTSHGAVGEVDTRISEVGEIVDVVVEVTEGATVVEGWGEGGEGEIVKSTFWEEEAFIVI